MLGGGAIFIFTRAQKARSHARGVRGHAPPKIFDKNGAIRFILVHSMAHFSLHYFAVFEVIFF